MRCDVVLLARRRGGRHERQDGVEDLAELVAEQARRVQQVRDPAQQVAEQAATRQSARNGGDAEVDLVELDTEAEQVEIERPEDEIQDAAAPDLLRGKLRGAGAGRR